MCDIDHCHIAGYINKENFRSETDCRKFQNVLTGKSAFYLVKKQQCRNFQKCHNRQNSPHIFAGAADPLHNLKHKVVKD